MEDSELIEQLQQKVREAEELLRRRREALAALKGKTGNSKNGRQTRGLRAQSIPALVYGAIKAAKGPLSLDELTIYFKKAHPDLDMDGRKISIALSRYVRNGQYFTFGDGKYGVK